jgi:hypothetical protein
MAIGAHRAAIWRSRLVAKPSADAGAEHIALGLFFLQMPVILARGSTKIGLDNAPNYTTVIMHHGASLISISSRRMIHPD